MILRMKLTNQNFLFAVAKLRIFGWVLIQTDSITSLYYEFTKIRLYITLSFNASFILVKTRIKYKQVEMFFYVIIPPKK